MCVCVCVCVCVRAVLALLLLTRGWPVIQPGIQPRHRLMGTARIAEQRGLEKRERLRVVDVLGVGPARVTSTLDVRDLFPGTPGAFFVLAAVAAIEPGVACEREVGRWGGKEIGRGRQRDRERGRGRERLIE